MRNIYMKTFSVITLLLGVSILILSGCTSTAPDGPMPENQSPRCFLANVPVEGEEYSYNPELFWYGTDADGFIKKFRYFVVKAEDINDDPLTFIEGVMASGNYDGWTSIDVDSLSSGESATSDQISLYAVADPDTYTPQYFFVQAIDNHDAVSDFTDTTTEDGILVLAYRKYSRNNHPPETYLNLNLERDYFSISDTTIQYRGIPVSWDGSDSLDYKKAQPRFEYNWKVFDRLIPKRSLLPICLNWFMNPMIL